MLPTSPEDIKPAELLITESNRRFSLNPNVKAEQPGVLVDCSSRVLAGGGTSHA